MPTWKGRGNRYTNSGIGIYGTALATSGWNRPRSKYFIHPLETKHQQLTVVGLLYMCTMSSQKQMSK